MNYRCNFELKISIFIFEKTIQNDHIPLPKQVPDRKDGNKKNNDHNHYNR